MAWRERWPGRWRLLFQGSLRLFANVFLPDGGRRAGDEQEAGLAVRPAGQRGQSVSSAAEKPLEAWGSSGFFVFSPLRGPSRSGLEPGFGQFGLLALEDGPSGWYDERQNGAPPALPRAVPAKDRLWYELPGEGCIPAADRGGGGWCQKTGGLLCFLSNTAASCVPRKRLSGW